MKLTDIYGKRPPRLTRPWADAMKACILKLGSDILEARATVSSSPQAVDGPIDAAATAVSLFAQDYAFAVEFGSEIAIYPPAFIPLEKGMRCSVSPVLRARQIASDLAPYAGMLPIMGQINRFNIPAGVCLVTGGGGVGKTPMAHAIADFVTRDDEQGFGLVRFGEPFTGYLKTEREAARELVSEMVSHRAVVIDSMKDVLSTLGGSLMESGLSRDSLPLFSRLSMVASELGILLVCPINPSSSKKTVVELIAEVARSNVAMAVIGEKDTWSVLTRRGEGLMRDQAEAALSFNKGVPLLEFTPMGEISDAVIELAIEQAMASETTTSAGESLGGFALAMRRLSRQS